MTERIFGTDGIRARAGTGPLTPENILRVGRALGSHLWQSHSGDERPRVLLGVDPRPSADFVGTTLASGLIAERCDVHWPGMMSTPEVAFLTRNGPFAAGVVVTASHNPAHDNGIKIFSAEGEKLDPAIEAELETAIQAASASTPADVPDNTRHGWLHLGRQNFYEEFILKTFRASFESLSDKPLSIVVDCAFGARSIDIQTISRLARSLVMGRTTPDRRLESPMRASDDSNKNVLDVTFLNAASPSQPDTHHLINHDCGSLHPNACAEVVLDTGADLGICFDGDGDRVVLIDEKGIIRDGDFMLGLLAQDMKLRGVLKNDTVVGTSMANLGLDQFLTEQGIQFIRTDVGDRNVWQAMKADGHVLGGEQSGHIICSDEGHTSGDGLYSALRIIEVMLDTGAPLSKLCADIRKFPQRLENLRVESKPPLDTLATLIETKATIEGELATNGRVNVRYSGTEPLLRIMVEAETDAMVDDAIERLINAAQKDLA